MTVKIVKSVGRVFEILELFKAKQSFMSIADISKALNYPHSSTLSILKSMVELGYLNEANRFNFFPSYELFNLTNWLSESIEDDILNFMADLHELTGETINLSKRNGDYVKIIHGILGNHAITINVREGTLMPAHSSFVGLSLLATLDDKAIADILNGLEEQNVTPSFPRSKIKKLISEIRQDTIAAGHDLFIKGIGAITIPVHSIVKKETYIIGIVGPTERLRENQLEYLNTVHDLMKKHKIHFLGVTDN